MRDLVERAYFTLCLALGWMLRSARYAEARIVHQDGELRVRKRRRFYAPLLVWLGVPLVKILDTGVRVLPQRDWEDRERSVYRSVHGASIRIDAERSRSCVPDDNVTLTGATLVIDVSGIKTETSSFLSITFSSTFSTRNLGYDAG